MGSIIEYASYSEIYLIVELLKAILYMIQCTIHVSIYVVCESINHTHIYFFLFLQGRIFIKKIQQKKTIYIYNIVITVELQMGHTLYIIKIIVSIMDH